MVQDTIAQTQVTYVSVGVPTITATTGLAAQTLTQASVKAWRGNPIETESPAPDTAVRQYVIAREDLDGGGITDPARGDYIQDGTAEYGIDKVERGEVGGDILYWLFSTTLRNP